MFGNWRKSGEKARKINVFQNFRATPKPWVVGSSPSAPAKKSDTAFAVSGFFC